MGNSAVANLFWGFPAGHEDEGGDDSLSNTWEDKVAEAAGHPRPTAEYSDAAKPEYLAYWELKRADVKTCGCEVGYFGSDDCQTLFFCVSESALTADWGETSEIPTLTVNPEWEAKLRAFCATLGIKWQEPKWYLTAYY